MAQEVDIAWFKGEDAALVFTLTPTTDITGWTFSFTVRDRFGGTSILSKTSGSGIAITSAAAGIFTVTIASADTNTTTFPGVFVYDASRTNSGSQAVLAIGQCRVKPEVTIQ